jgi:hypothetical protein
MPRKKVKPAEQPAERATYIRITPGRGRKSLKLTPIPSTTPFTLDLAQRDILAISAGGSASIPRTKLRKERPQKPESASLVIRILQEKKRNRRLSAGQIGKKLAAQDKNNDGYSKDKILGLVKRHCQNTGEANPFAKLAPAASN